MPTATRTFRVFVSSTFEDLKAERDALQRDVFPKLRKLCEEIGARFQAIDLRWGVRDEAALDQQTLEICLREIERCQQTGIKPNFIVLLGQRYGWRPLPVRIEADEFERVRDLVASAADQQRTKDWYERDDNAVPPEYLLKPRTGEFVDKDRWDAIEQDLHRILREGARNAGLTREKLIKYGVSATHQEILKGLGATEEDRKHVFAFFRDPAPVITEDSDLTALKQDLREKLDNENIHSFSAADLAKLCADVEDLLKQVILAETGRFKSRPALDLEIHAHETFASERARHFTGRKTVLDAIDAHFQSGESRPLVVHGPSGCGKSAIIAKASEQAKAKMPGVVLIQRFIGVTPDASNGLTLLRSLCEQLSREYGVSEETPLGFQPLVVAFHDRMARATEERPLVLFLDALDQLRANDEVHSFTWLRQTLPQHVSLVASATEIPAGLKNASQVAVEDFPVDDAAEVLAAWLEDAKPKRKLQPEQRQKVLSGFAQSKLPLYLKLAFEEARRWPSFNTAETCDLGGDVGGMIEVLFDRLSQESNHGPLLVNRSLGFLAAARYGLTEDEMLDVLSADDDVWQDFKSRAHHTPPARQLPVIVWSRLYLDIEPYLNERSVPGGNVMAFYHRQLAERAASRYLEEDEGTLRHAGLAKYFTFCAKGADLQKEWETDSVRGFSECVFHLVRAGQYDGAAGLLSNFPFLLHKTRVGLHEGALDDYEIFGREAPSKESERLETWMGFFRKGGHILRRGDENWPAYKILLQLAVEHADDSPVTIAAERWLAEGRCDWWWLRRVPREPQAEESRCETILEGHASGVMGALELTDGRLLSWSYRTLRLWDSQNGRCLVVLEGHSDAGLPIGGALELADRRLLSWAPDRTLRLWDSQSGASLAVLQGHTSAVTGALELANGWLLSWSEDGTSRLWNGQSGACLAILKEPNKSVWGVLELADGRLLTWSGDDKLRLWDSDRGECVGVLNGHTGWVAGALELADGRLLSWSHDGTLRLWDSDRGECLSVLEGHNSFVLGAKELTNGRLLSWSGDGTLRLWDGHGSACLAVLEGHTGWMGARELADGRLLSWSGKYAVPPDGTLRVWDGHSGACLAVLNGHTGEVKGALELADGRLLSWSVDAKLRLWDSKNGECLEILAGHSERVNGAMVLADSRLLSWSDDRTLRLWEGSKGTSSWFFERGHTDWVGGLLELTNGRLLSWSNDHTLRIWDGQSGALLEALYWHTHWVHGALELAGGRLLSWSHDGNLVLWDSQNGDRLEVLAGHKCNVRGVLALDNRRLLSWAGSPDNTLRMWEDHSANPESIESRWRNVGLAVLEGHTWGVNGARALTDGRLLSWSEDGTLRLWDGHCG
jgi:WD40 repeat protein/ABC-type cobalamin/Fe3+-siderophores transport system ATPase subunit